MREKILVTSRRIKAPENVGVGRDILNIYRLITKTLTR